MAFVQGASGLTTASSTTATTSAPITVTAGHTIVVWGCISTSGNPFGSFSSSQGDTFSSIVSFATSGNQTVNAAIITSAVGGSTSFTIHTTGVNSNLMYIGVAEFSGRVGTFEQLGNAFSTPFVSSHSNPATPNPVQAGDDLVALICDVVGPVGHVETFTATGAWTATAVQNGNGTTGDLPLGMIMYQNNVAAANYTATYTTFTNVQSANVILGLPAVSGASLPASTGPFAITGFPANLSASTVQPMLFAFPGTYNISGAPASSDFEVIAASGSYFYFGSPASLSVVLPSQVLSAAAGSYSIAAQDAILAPFIIPPSTFPSVVGQYYWIATLILQQTGYLVPSKIGYFGTWPITIVWEPSKLSPGEVIAQSVAPGTPNFIPNSPITLTVSEFPIGVVAP